MQKSAGLCCQLFPLTNEAGPSLGRRDGSSAAASAKMRFASGRGLGECVAVAGQVHPLQVRW